jgi:hypothetical protein
MHIKAASSSTLLDVEPARQAGSGRSVSLMYTSAPEALSNTRRLARHRKEDLGSARFKRQPHLRRRPPAEIANRNPDLP